MRRRIAELEERRATLAADRMREEALGQDAAAAIARLEEELAAIAARLDEAESRRGTIDVRTVAHEDEARAAESALGQARAVQAAEQAEARVAIAALDAARQKQARAESEAARIAEQMSGLGGDANLLATPSRPRGPGASRPKPRSKGRSAAIGAAEATRQQAAAARDAAESEAAAARAALPRSSPRRGARSRRSRPRAATGRSTISRPRPAMSARSPPLSARISTPRSPATGRAAGPAPSRWRAIRRCPPAPARSPIMSRRRRRCSAGCRQIAVVEADEVVALAVGQRLVTMDGRLRRWDGYVATGLGAAAAERLIRVNRLAEIETALPAAAAAVEAAERDRRRRWRGCSPPARPPPMPRAAPRPRPAPRSARRGARKTAPRSRSSGWN